VALFVLALLEDRWVFHHFTKTDLYDRGWARMFRMAGDFPFWALVGLALVLQDWAPRTLQTLGTAARRGLLLFWSTALGGLAAELLKIVIRRDRPGPNDGEWVFRAWSDRPFNTSQLGLPSSEAAVAFAAAAMLARLFPRGRELWYTLALACALTRVVAGAHFLSDVVLAAIVGYLVSAILWRSAIAHPGAESTRQTGVRSGAAPAADR
jgi:membrane-associated phospholipid phosphatase